jgi:SAM-dependent methyltransferase
MSKNPAKDFGPIADDYAFFETNSTEPQADCRAYRDQLGSLIPQVGAIRMLDFGCGSGTFTARFLEEVGWPAARLHLTLVEPVETARLAAVARLARSSEHPIVDAPALPTNTAGRFDVVLANHCLYYVSELKQQLASLIGARSPGGVFTTAIAGRANALIEFWIRGFGLLKREIPYNISEDVEAALQQQGAAYEKQPVPYELTFPDSEENRMRIIRFLLAEHLAQIPRRPLLDVFDQHAKSGRIMIRTECDHYTVRAS